MPKIIIPDNQAELLAAWDAEHQAQVNGARDDYHKIVRAGIAKWVDDFKRGAIKIETVGDLRQLIELDLLLRK